MPIIVALAVRYVIMAAVQLGIWSLIEKYGLPLLDTAIIKTAEMFGVSEEDAQAFVANSLLKAFEEVGIFAITLRTKLPIKVAERLGFTTKGFNARKLSVAAEAKLPKVAAVATAETVATTEEVTKVAEAIAKSRMTPFAVVSSVYKAIMAFVGVTALVAMTVGNFIDFGNWQGAYQKTFQKLFTALGFPPDSPMPKSKAVSATTWTKIYTIVEELNPATIAFPWDDTIKPYSRNNLADAVDHFSANLAVHGVNPTWKSVWGLLLPTLGLKTPAGATIVAPTGATPTVITPQVAQVRVVSGVVSQGIIGSTAVFTPRPDDLIENAAELETAMHNNIAPFIASLGSLMSYEVKIVPSVKSASGFTQRGTVQRVVSGYNKDGSPKYRTVVNKFAVAYIYLKTEQGTQSKIKTIVLGPVDSVRYQAANVNVTAVATSVQQNIVAPASVVAPTATPAMVPIVPIPAKGVFQGINPPLWGTLYKIVGGARLSYDPFPDLYTQAERDKLSQDPGKFAGNEQKLKDRGVITSDIITVPFIADKQPGETQPERGMVSFTEFFGATQPVTATPTSTVATGLWQLEKSDTPNGIELIFYPAGKIPDATLRYPGSPAPATTKEELQKNATSLFIFYAALGQSLVSVEERSKLYEQLALGKASYYTGTAEQNTKLLAALQGQRL